MCQYRFHIAFIVLLLSATGVMAQGTNTCVGCKTVDINFTELANYYKEHPLPIVRKMPMEEEEEEGRREHRHAPASEIRLYHAPDPVDVTDDHYHEPMLPVSPAPDDTF